MIWASQSEKNSERVLAPQQMEPIKKKIRLLRHSDRLERQPRVRARLNDKFHLLHKAIPSIQGEIAVSPNTQKQTQRA